MMHQKAYCFNDMESVNKIWNTNDVKEIKQLGRLVQGYNENCWSGIRQLIAYDGLREKFLQNEELKKMLLGMKDAVLAECAVRDRIWGIGLSMTDGNRFDRDKWRGQNLFGYSLMMVRKKIKKFVDFIVD